MKQLSKTLVHILTISLLAFLLPTSTVSAATPTYIYEWMSQSGTISSDGEAHEYTNLEAGQTINLSLTLINRSNVTIKAKSNLPSSPNLQVPVGSYGIGSQTPHQDGTPYFLDTSSFVLNNNRFAYYEGSDVLPNEAISMSWNIKLANNLSDGVYNLYVRPVSEYLAWTRQIKLGKLLPTTSSDIFWRLTVGEGWSASVSPGVYFAQGVDAPYQLIDVDSGKSSSFIPSGYKIVSQHEYDVFPQYLILQKDNRLFSYNVRNNIINLVGLSLADDEVARVRPSMTEPDRFFIELDKREASEGMFGYVVVGTRSYTFNAGTNSIVGVSNVEISSYGDCYNYDSKNGRFFSWPCGEGVGSSTPLTIRSLNGAFQRNVLTASDFGINTEEQINAASIRYNNGVFIAVKRQSLPDGDNKIIVVDPNNYNPTKTSYALDAPIDISIRSVAILEGNNTIIIGGSDSIMLLRYNSYTRNIIDRENIPDAGIYVNFMFVYNGKAYYQAPQTNVIRVVDLATWRIEKSLATHYGEAVTLLLFD